MGSADQIAEGRAAWHAFEMTGAGSMTWILIGKALAIGRTEALAFAQTNKPQGSRYNAEMNQWLRAAGLDGVSAPDSCRLAAAPNFGSLGPRADIAPIKQR